MATIKPISVPPKKLSRSITSASSSFKVNNIKSWARNSLGVNINLTASDFGTRAFCVFRNDTGTKIEIMEFDPATIASSDITILKRGLGFNGDLDTETTAYKLDWSANETTVNFGTDAPQLLHYLGRKQIIYKSSNETVNNSTVLQNDDTLVFPIGANEIWAFEIIIIFSTNDTPDFQYAFTAPVGATYNYNSFYNYNSGSNESSGPAFIAPNTADTYPYVEVVKGVVINSSTAGNFQLQWAQSSQNASNTIVKAGSHIIATRLSP